MKVKKLIENLKQYDENKEVNIVFLDNDFTEYTTEIKFIGINKKNGKVYLWGEK